MKNLWPSKRAQLLLIKPPFWAHDPPSLANEPLIGVPEPQRKCNSTKRDKRPTKWRRPLWSGRLTPFVGTQSGFFLFFAEKRLSVTYLIFRSSKWYSWQLFHPVHGLFVCFSIGRLCPQSDLSSLGRIHKWQTKSVEGMLNKTGSLCCLHDALSSHKDVPLENIIKHV